MLKIDMNLAFLNPSKCNGKVECVNLNWYAIRYVPLAWQMKAGHELNNEEFCVVCAVVKQDWKD